VVSSVDAAALKSIGPRVFGWLALAAIGVWHNTQV